MNGFKKIGLALALAQVLAPAVNAAELYGTKQIVNQSFVESTDSYELLNEAQLAETRGKLAPLALVTAIAGLDLALIGVFWGVYVPSYGGGGSCPSCSLSNTSDH